MCQLSILTQRSQHAQHAQPCTRLQRSRSGAGAAVDPQAAAARRSIAATISALPWYHESCRYERLCAASQLQISPYTPMLTPLAAPLTVWVDAKNVGPSVAVSLYRISLEGWLAGGAVGGLEVGADVDLTAVVPSEVLTVATSGSELMAERLKLELPNTAGRRGTVVVDVAARGKMCRCAAWRSCIRPCSCRRLLGPAGLHVRGPL